MTVQHACRAHQRGSSASWLHTVLGMSPPLHTCGPHGPVCTAMILVWRGLTKRPCILPHFIMLVVMPGCPVLPLARHLCPSRLVSSFRGTSPMLRQHEAWEPRPILVFTAANVRTDMAV